MGTSHSVHRRYLQEQSQQLKHRLKIPKRAQSEGVMIGARSFTQSTNKNSLASQNASRQNPKTAPNQQYYQGSNETPNKHHYKVKKIKPRTADPNFVRSRSQAKLPSGSPSQNALKFRSQEDLEPKMVDTASKQEMSSEFSQSIAEYLPNASDKYSIKISREIGRPIPQNIPTIRAPPAAYYNYRTLAPQSINKKYQSSKIQQKTTLESINLRKDRQAEIATSSYSSPYFNQHGSVY